MFAYKNRFILYMPWSFHGNHIKWTLLGVTAVRGGSSKLLIYLHTYYIFTTYLSHLTWLSDQEDCTKFILISVTPLKHLT